MDTEFVMLIMIFTSLFLIPFMRLCYGMYCKLDETNKVGPGDDRKSSVAGRESMEWSETGGSKRGIIMGGMDGGGRWRWDGAGVSEVCVGVGRCKLLVRA